MEKEKPKFTYAGICIELHHAANETHRRFKEMEKEGMSTEEMSTFIIGIMLSESKNRILKKYL